jgi:PAS domain S-box-containing protein
MSRFPGIGQRVKARLKALGYWRDGRTEIGRFCEDKGYRPQYLYAWLGDRIPTYENLVRLARDLGVQPEWIMFGAGPTGRPHTLESGAGPSGARRGQIIDFARLREVTSRLVRLEGELQAIVRAFPDLYFWLDAEGTFLAYEGGRGSEFHVPPDLILGKKIADAFPPEVSPRLEQAARDASSSIAVASVEFGLGTRSYEARFLPLDPRQPAQGQLLMIVREITERKQAEDAAGALARVSHELAGTLDLAEASERVVSTVLDLFRVGHAGLFTLDPGSDTLVCVAIAGEGHHDKWKGRTLPPGAGVVGRAILEGRAVWSPDVGSGDHSDIPEWLRERTAVEGHRSVVAVPLISRGEVLGALSLASSSERVFTEGERGLLSGFADAAALALQNARLYDDARRRRREAEVVAELAGRISASLDLGEVLQAVVEGARELCRSDLATICLREPDSEALVMRYWAGSTNPYLAGIRIEPGRGIGGLVFTTGRPFRTDDYVADHRFTKDYLAPVEADEIVTALVVPIRIDQKAEGLLYVHNRAPRPFTDRDESILTRLADHAAIAIRNARLYESSESRRRAAESLADVGRLISQSLDPDVVAQGIADSVLTLFGARASAILQVRPESGELLAIAVAGELTLGVAPGVILPLGVGASGLAASQRLPVVTPDLLSDATVTLPPGLRSAIEASSYRAALAVPLLVRDEATGALVVRDRTGRRFDEEDVRLLQAFADQAALALENAWRFRETELRRAEAQAAAADSEQRFRNLTQGLTAIVWEADAAIRQTTFISPAAEEILGYPRERWYAERDFWLDHLHPDDRARFAPPTYAMSAEDHELQYRMIAADGRVVWFRDFVHVVPEGDGRPRRLHGVMVDITEGRRAEEATRALSEITHLLTLSLDRAAVARRIAESVRRLFGATIAVLYQAVPDSEVMIAIARAHVDSSPFDWARFLPRGTGLMGLAMREGRAVFSPDVLADRRITYTDEVRARIEHGRVRAMLAVPLIAKGVAVGALSIGDRPGRVFDEREVRLARAFADQAAVALADERRPARS